MRGVDSAIHKATDPPMGSPRGKANSPIVQARVYAQNSIAGTMEKNLRVVKWDTEAATTEPPQLFLPVGS